MSTVQQAIEVSAPLHAVYEQLATFESYPRFMTGVQQVIQTSSKETHWIMDLDGQRREFDAEITECSLDKRVAWATVGGPLLAETITLRPMGETRTQVVAQLEADVAALLPSDRHAQESLSRRLKADLNGLKRLLEQADDAQMSGTGTIAAGATGAASMLASVMTPPSPAAVAARMNRRKGTADPMSAADRAAMPGTEAMPGTGAMPGGTQTGGAGMGGHAMGPDDAWGDGMINEEERGSAYDM